MNVIVTLIANTPAPPGVMAVNYSYSIMSGTAVVGTPIVTTELTATFPAPAPGPYTAECVAVDATGTAVGTPASASFTVPTPSLMLPTSITVTLQ